MNKGYLLPILGFLLAGCSPVIVHPPESVDALLSGEVLFGETIDVTDLNSDEVLALDDEIRAYVHSKVAGLSHAKSRLRSLLGGMIDDGLLSLDYDQNLTYTARETFHKRQGNCLSFSNLFVAMAREADVDVNFQMVEIPPSFSSDGELILLNNHINIRVNRIVSNTDFIHDFVVDFNTAEYNGNFETKKVTDGYAIALYFSNLAVEAIQTGDTRSAFRYLKKGIRTDPGIAGLWVNLGALYSRHDHYDMAERAYRQALVIQPSNKSALVNLANTLMFLERQEEANYYLGKVTYYRDHNPYYHYSLAREAYQEQQYPQALEHLKAAIRLKKDEHQFFYLQGLTHYQMQATGEAEESFTRAKNAAEMEKLTAGYERKLQALDLQSNQQ
jgi:Flp pilus assembly protein TadD